MTHQQIKDHWKNGADSAWNPGLAVDVPKWLHDNQRNFVPPICNKLMFNNQLKVFFVGGPNQREDYHIELGEEFFYMIKGSMTLKVIEKGTARDVEIQQGQVFLLPPRVPHSPQRRGNTLGLVVERERNPSELDGLRYYVRGSKQILYERWFHCVDLGTQLAPIIQEYLTSDEYETGVPSASKFRWILVDSHHNLTIDSRLVPAPYQDDTTTSLMEPFSLATWLMDNSREINKIGHKELFDSSSSTKVMVYGGCNEHCLMADQWECYLWQLSLDASLSNGGKQRTLLKQGDATILPPFSRIQLETIENGYTLAVTMPGPVG